MANPEDKQMKMQWITVDGRTVPLVLPQIWDPDKEDWVVTSTENPLQVDAQLTGSKVVYKRQSFNFDLLEAGERQEQLIIPPAGFVWRIKFFGASIRGTGQIGLWVRYGSDSSENMILSMIGENQIEIQGNVVKAGQINEGPTQELSQQAALMSILSDETDFRILCINSSESTLERAKITLVYEEEKVDADW